MSRSSKSEGCSGPPASARAWICGAQAGDPVEAGRAQLLADARGGDHPTVADQHQVAQPEAALELVDLLAEGGRIGSVALEHLDGDRPALPVAQQPIDDLQPIRAMRGGSVSRYSVSVPIGGFPAG
jgi:hypothetical protein